VSKDIFNDSLVITLDQLKADSELVQQIEIRLKTLGLLDTAEVDGVWRNSTESALVEFCRLAFLNNMNTKVFGRTFAKKLIEMPGLINFYSLVMRHNGRKCPAVLPQKDL